MKTRTPVKTTECPACKGTGFTQDNGISWWRCFGCHGSGVIEVARLNETQFCKIKKVNEDGS